ncbi:MAG: hypothetical protein ACTIJ6_05025 [Leucobacter sp.]
MAGPAPHMVARTAHIAASEPIVEQAAAEATAAAARAALRCTEASCTEAERTAVA